VVDGKRRIGFEVAMHDAVVVKFAASLGDVERSRWLLPWPGRNARP
jgi:hypothetical protein